MVVVSEQLSQQMIKAFEFFLNRVAKIVVHFWLLLFCTLTLLLKVTS